MQEHGAAHEARGHQVQHTTVDQALVSITEIASGTRDRRAGLHAHEAEDVLVLGLAQPELERAADEVEEHDRGPCRRVGHEQQRDHQQTATIRLITNPTTPRELRQAFAGAPAPCRSRP